MKKWKWHLFLILSIALTVLFGYGAVSAYVDVTSPPKTKTLTKSEVSPVTPGDTYIAVGDSLSRGVGSSKGRGFVSLVGNDLKDNKTIDRFQNLGVSGARIEDLLEQLEQKEIKKTLKNAKIISISIGGNNLFNSGEVLKEFSEEKTLSVLKSEIPNLEKVFKSIRKNNPDAIVLYVGLYNPFRQSDDEDSFDSIVQNWNEDARKLGLKYKIKVVDTFNLVNNPKRDLSSDVFHPNDATYKQIADSMSLIIEKSIVR